MIYKLSIVQERQVSLLQNMSTVASLFSGVSATTLQYIGSAGSTFAQATNLCWVLSLILSTLCAVYCQLVIYWRSSTSRLPTSRIRVPWFLNVTNAPTILLASSAFIFLIGLIFFVFAASDRNQRYFAVVATIVVCLALTYAAYFMWAVVGRSDRRPRPDLEVEAAPGPVPSLSPAPKMLAIDRPRPPKPPFLPILPIPPPVPVRTTFGMHSYDGDMMDYPP